MDAYKSKIKLKPESIKKNMLLSIQLTNKKTMEGYFKKFMFRNQQIPDVKRQGQYRDTIEDIKKDFGNIPQE